MNAPWMPLGSEGECSVEEDMEVKVDEMVCCSTHLYSSFAIGQAFDVAEDRYVKVIGALVSFNVFCLLFIILGTILDLSNKLQFGKAVVSNKFNANADGAAAVDNDITHGAPSGQIPDKSQSTSAFKDPTMNPIGVDKEAGSPSVDANDIKIDVEPVADTPAKMLGSPTKPAAASKSKVDEEGVSDVYGRPLSVCQYYSNAFRYYTRIGSMVCSSQNSSFRAVKALNSFAQLAIAMCIVCSIMGPMGVEV